MYTVLPLLVLHKLGGRLVFWSNMLYSSEQLHWILYSTGNDVLFNRSLPLTEVIRSNNKKSIERSRSIDSRFCESHERHAPKPPQGKYNLSLLFLMQIWDSSTIVTMSVVHYKRWTSYLNWNMTSISWREMHMCARVLMNKELFIACCCYCGGVAFIILLCTFHRIRHRHHLKK